MWLIANEYHFSCSSCWSRNTVVLLLVAVTVRVSLSLLGLVIGCRQKSVTAFLIACFFGGFDTRSIFVGSMSGQIVCRTKSKDQLHDIPVPYEVDRRFLDGEVAQMFRGYV